MTYKSKTSELPPMRWGWGWGVRLRIGGKDSQHLIDITMKMKEDRVHKKNQHSLITRILVEKMGKGESKTGSAQEYLGDGYAHTRFVQTLMTL